MVQDILTIIALLSASSYAIYSLIKIIASAKEKKTACPGCSACAQPKQTVYKFDKKLTIKKNDKSQSNNQIKIYPRMTIFRFLQPSCK